MQKVHMLFILIILIMSGCTSTQKGAAVGGLSGAALGGIIGHQSGDGVKGAAIGGAIGTVGGMLVGEKLEKKFCPVCGAGYTEDVEFCPKDGAELNYKQ